nr:integrase, catalytic region, zinc finger, CCHC-type, peptidase aspartic, catalytic [Tanacetum cinerariifolium]
MVITLKWIYKVKLDELGGLIKNKARLVARGYRQEEGIDFEEQVAILREVVKQGKYQNPLNNFLDHALGNSCPLTRITTTIDVPSRKLFVLETDTPKPVVTLVYSQKPRKSKTTNPVSKSKVIQIVLWYLDSDCSKHMTGDRSQLTNFVNKFLGTVKFKNDHVAKIMGYGDYQIGNIMISRVYYVEGLGHNLFFVGEFCDSNLEALKTKSWLWHRRLSHLNFGTINHLDRHGLVREENHDLDVVHMNNDLFFGISIPENDSESSFSDVIPTVVHTAAPNSEHVTKWTKDHPLDNIIGELKRLVSTRLQLY